MGPHGGTDAVNGSFIFVQISFKGSVHSLFQGLKACLYRDDPCPQHLHTGNVGRLLFNVHLPHVDIAFQSEISGSRSQCHAVLPGAGLGDEFLFAQILGQQAFAHAMVQLMGAGVVKIFPLEVDLYVSQKAAEPCAMIYRGRPALKLATDAAQLADKLGAVADALVCIGDLLKGGDQLRRKITAAVSAKAAVFGGESAQIFVQRRNGIHDTKAPLLLFLFLGYKKIAPAAARTMETRYHLASCL